MENVEFNCIGERYNFITGKTEQCEKKGECKRYIQYKQNPDNDTISHRFAKDFRKCKQFVGNPNQTK